MSSEGTRRLKRQAAAASMGTRTVGVIGDGGFAAALAGLMVSAGHTAALWMRDTERRNTMRQHRRHDRLPGIGISPRVLVAEAADELTQLAELIIVAVPSTHLGSVCEELANAVHQEHIIAHTIGGLAPGERRVSEFLRASLDCDRIAVIAGPVLPVELAHRRTSAVVVAADELSLAQEVKALIETAPLRVYCSEDLVGVELASALAGAITVVAGIADGLALGNAPKAVLMTRALAEACRIGAASGAGSTAFYGMAGLGTVLLRCARGSCEHSSDFQVGRALATEVIPPEWQTEGVRVLAAANRVARLFDLSTPILETAYLAVGREISLDEAQDRLISWATGHE